jgi:hypothetical protein
MAVREVLRRYGYMLYGHKITIYLPSTWSELLSSEPTHTKRLQKANEKIHEFGAEIRSVPKRLSRIADYLRMFPPIEIREPEINTSLDLDELDLPGFFCREIGFDESKVDSDLRKNLANLSELQRKDSALQKWIKWNKHENIEYHGYQACLNSWGHPKILVSQVLRRSIIEFYHIHYCHPGLHAMRRLII